MSILVLDTNVVSYLMKGHELAERYRPHLEGQTLAISFMTVGELFEGAYRAGWNEDRLTRLEGEIRRYVVVPSSPDICKLWGEVRSARRTQPIAGEDAWVAATALAHHCPLVTHDSDGFHGIHGLEIITEGN